MSNEEVYEIFKQYTERVWVSKSKNTTWELKKTHKEWDKQHNKGVGQLQTEKSIWNLNNTHEE